MNDNKEKFVRERSWQTQALVDVLIGLKENEIVGYEALAAQCKIDVASVKRRLASARTIALAEHHVVIDTVRGIGVARLSQDLVPAPVGRQMTRARNASRKGIKLIRDGVTDFAKLPTDVRTTLYMQRALLGAVVLSTDRSSRRVLKEHAETSNSELSIGRTLELLK